MQYLKVRNYVSVAKNFLKWNSLNIVANVINNLIRKIIKKINNAKNVIKFHIILILCLVKNAKMKKKYFR